MKDKDKVKGRYFYLMLKENFYDNDDMVLLESMENGYKYSNILLKLYLKSLKDKGKLMYKDRIPYSVEMIAKLTRHDSDTVRRAIEIFQQMGIIEILDNGAIFMMDIENYIGKSSTEADRRRAYDRRIAEEKRKILIENTSDNLQEISCEKSHEHIDIELDTDLDLKKEQQENLFLYLENNFGRTISPSEIELLWSWLDTFNEDIIKYSIDISCFNNKKTIKYTNGILNNWKSKGYTKLEECKEDSKGGNKSEVNNGSARDGSEYSMYD